MEHDQKVQEYQAKLKEFDRQFQNALETEIGRQQRLCKTINAQKIKTDKKVKAEKSNSKSEESKGGYLLILNLPLKTLAPQKLNHQKKNWPN